jgi:hypothetical protein
MGVGFFAVIYRSPAPRGWPYLVPIMMGMLRLKKRSRFASLLVITAQTASVWNVGINRRHKTCGSTGFY